MSTSRRKFCLRLYYSRNTKTMRKTFNYLQRKRVGVVLRVRKSCWKVFAHGRWRKDTALKRCREARVSKVLADPETCHKRRHSSSELEYLEQYVLGQSGIICALKVQCPCYFQLEVKYFMIYQFKIFNSISVLYESPELPGLKGSCRDSCSISTTSRHATHKFPSFLPSPFQRQP